MTRPTPPIVRAHESGAHRDRWHGLCPACRHERRIEAEWVRRAARRELPVKVLT